MLFKGLFPPWLCSMWDLKFPNQGLNPCPLQRKHGVLTTKLPGKSFIIFKLKAVERTHFKTMQILCFASNKYPHFKHSLIDSCPVLSCLILPWWLQNETFPTPAFLPHLLVNTGHSTVSKDGSSSQFVYLFISEIRTYKFFNDLKFLSTLTLL